MIKPDLGSMVVAVGLASIHMAVVITLFAAFAAAVAGQRDPFWAATKWTLSGFGIFSC